MSESTPAAATAAASSPIRTLAVRIVDDLRAQLDVIAQLNDRSVTEEIRLALEAWVQTSKSDPKVLARAETVRAEIDREAKTKQSAIEAIFGGPVGSKPPRQTKQAPA
ncbi:ribbon-helix-helix domain-containing protein [Agrococcus baldri]|uniref:Uncharacterized protein n=1 Tax=Agrococcus baldri TaxID=153730 RepID=A0AA87RCH2_9MICO|nr:hypothetical protein [Agrococcus baldri]GEK80137.1 hypothetical protein ABA31_14880 [Agrococcus baldri]